VITVSSTGRRVRLLATASAILALGVLGAGPASAHSQLTSTSPVDGAVLDTAPTEVRLTFDSTLLDDTDTISINDENGNVVSSIHPKPEGDSVAIPWPAGTPAGTYQVAYRVVCGDGHPVVGAINVTLTAAAAGASNDASAAASAAASSAASIPSAPPSPSMAAEPAAPSSGLPLPLVASALVLAAAAVATAAVLVRRRRGAHT
jgi:methionine-rich copper-binding protein CopC